MLLDAVTFLRGAVAKTSGTPALYMFHEGWCYARSAAILAAYPTPDLVGTFGLAAASLEPALDRFKKEPEISAGENGTLVLKTGRLRATLNLLYCDPPPNIDIEHAWQTLPSRFIDALRDVRPFMSKDGTWQRGVKLFGNKITAINQRSAVEVEVGDLNIAQIALLSDDAVAYLASANEPPAEFCLDGGTLSFRWSNGAWLRCQLLNFEWPEAADRALNMGGDDAAIVISEEWRAAFADAAALADGNLGLNTNGFTGKLDFSRIDIEFPTGVEKQTTWAIDALEPVMKLADRWNPDAASGVARFYGKNLRGIIAGVRS